MQRTLKGMSVSLKKIEKNGLTMAASMRVASGAEGMISNMAGSTSRKLQRLPATG